MVELPPQSKVCPFRLTNGPAIQVVVGLEAADPLTLAFLRSEPSPSELLLRLMLDLIDPGATVLDLGAHVGTFSLTAAAAGCRVVAVEGSPRNAALLRASAALNGFGDRLRVVPAVASNVNGTIAFSPHGPWGHVATEKTGLPSVSIAAVRVEDLLDERGMRNLAFIKMDVEGSEVSALEGMSRLLKHAGAKAPPLLYESNYVGLHYYDRTPGDLKETLRGLGYACHYAIQPGVLRRVNPDHFQPEVCGEYLATRRPPAIRGWRIGAPLSVREVTRVLAQECLASELPGSRTLLARSLGEAPAELLAYPPLRELLDWLRGEDASREFPRKLLRRLQPPGHRLRQGARRWLGRLFRLLRRAG